MIALILSCLLSLQNLTVPDSLPYLALDKGNNISLASQRFFPGKALYGFMNGGSDLFLEYGFVSLLEQKIEYKGRSFSAEYYLFDNPKAAFGIYSIHCFGCKRTDSLARFECSIVSYIQLVRNTVYFTLVCDSPADAQNEILLQELASQYLELNPEQTPDPALDGFSSTRDYYVKGNLGLSMACIEWVDYFQNFEHFELYLHREDQSAQTDQMAPTKGCDKLCAKVIFESQEQAADFAAQEGVKTGLKIRIVNPTEIYIESL